LPPPLKPVLAEIAGFVEKVTGGRVSMCSSGFVGASGAERIPTVLGDGLSDFVQRELDVIDCSEG